MEGQKKKKKAEGCTRGSNIGGEERESNGGKFELDARKKKDMERTY